MSPFSLIRTAFAVTAAIVVIAGCASADVGTGRAGVGSVVGSGSAAGSASDQPAFDSPANAPARSIAPTGPAATAATGSPPPTAPHATARLGGITVACPNDPWPGGEPALPPLNTKATIVAVVRCEAVQRSYDGLGEWTVQLAEVANSGFDQLLAALRRPSEKTPPNVACPAIGYVTPWFALVTADGSVVRAAIPTGQCGEPHADATTALHSLPYEVVDAVRTRQNRSPESVATGCEQQWKDMVALEGARQRAGSTGGGVADLASAPASVLVCLYKVVGAGVPEGDLIMGATVTGEVAGDIASGVEITNPLPAGCVDADRFVVVHNGRWISYVELGECNRVLTSDGRIGTASGSLVTTLKAVLRMR